LFAFYFRFPTSHTTVRTVLVYDCSLISRSDRFVVTREENVTGFSQTLVSNRTVKDKTAGSVPVTFPGIRPLIRLVSIDTQLDEIGYFGFNPFPLFPNYDM
jgi:hypothetical protein